MNIRIIKNAHDIKGKVYSGKFILEKEFEPSEYEAVKLVKYYIYDAESNSRTELLPDRKKYDILRIKSLDRTTQCLYFTTISDKPAGGQNITLYKYDIQSGSLDTIYRYDEDISQYVDYKRTQVFVLNDFYLLFQNEYIRYNLTETFKGYFEFEQFLYCVKDGKSVQIIDENLRANGIESIKLVNNNICVIKTGFNLMFEDRYKNLEKNEASLEKISFVNLGQLVSDILLMQKNIVIDTIDQAYYTETFPYVSVKGKYIVYSKVNTDRHEEEVIFYNFDTKETMLCINRNIYGAEDLAWGYVIGQAPYIRLRSKNGTQFYNLIKNKTDIKFPENVKVETVVNDMFIVSGTKKRFPGRKKPVISVYRYPDMELLHSENGEYIGCVATDRNNVYIMVS